MKQYFSLMQTGSVADLDIYGEITSWPFQDSDVSAAKLSHQLEKLAGVTQINVHINSYGGEVSEGLAIYNALRRHPAQITTTCDGMACSIASVIFMAGDERIMSESSLLMIHNAYTFAAGDAAELRKQADDVETINEASKTAYLSRVSISEEELASMMDAETFILPDDAVSMGFATAIEVFDRADAVAQAAAQSARNSIIQRLTGGKMFLIEGAKIRSSAGQFLKRGVNHPRGADGDDESDDTEETTTETPDNPDDDEEKTKQANPPDRDPDDDPDDPDDPDDEPDDPDRPDDPDDPEPEKKPKASQRFAQFLMKEVC